MKTMLVAGGLALLFSQGTMRPGEIPRPDVFIKNAPNEPIPIDIRELHVDGARPLPVELHGTEPIRVRLVPPTWAYRTVTIGAGGDPAAALQSLGASGWETTGLSWRRGEETLVLLKMQR